MKSKTFSGGLILFLIFTAFIQTVYAENLITNRTGTIKITNPDGTVLTVGKDEPLPDITSGAIVEVLDGGMDVVPSEGFIQVVVGGSVATVEAGDRATVFIDRETGMADFKIDAGEINAIAGNTTVLIRADQRVQIGLDKITGIAEVRGVKGVIETITACVKASVPESAIAKMSADAETRTVHVKSESGLIGVISIDEKITKLTEGGSIDTPGCAVGEIQTFPGEAITVLPLREEPAEPERPEASPFRP